MCTPDSEEKGCISIAVLALKPVFSGDWGGVDGAKKSFVGVKARWCFWRKAPWLPTGIANTPPLMCCWQSVLSMLFTRSAPRICSDLWRQTPILSGHCVIRVGRKRRIIRCCCGGPARYLKMRLSVPFLFPTTLVQYWVIEPRILFVHKLLIGVLPRLRLQVTTHRFFARFWSGWRNSALKS